MQGSLGQTHGACDFTGRTSLDASGQPRPPAPRPLLQGRAVASATLVRSRSSLGPVGGMRLEHEIFPELRGLTDHSPGGWTVQSTGCLMGCPPRPHRRTPWPAAGVWGGVRALSQTPRLHVLGRVARAGTSCRLDRWRGWALTRFKIPYFNLVFDANFHMSFITSVSHMKKPTGGLRQVTQQALFTQTPEETGARPSGPEPAAPTRGVSPSPCRGPGAPGGPGGGPTCARPEGRPTGSAAGVCCDVHATVPRAHTHTLTRKSPQCPWRHHTREDTKSLRSEAQTLLYATAFYRLSQRELAALPHKCNTLHFELHSW